MKRALFALLLLSACATDDRLFTLKSDPVKDKMDIRLVEKERTPTTSLVRVEIREAGSSVGNSMFIYEGVVKLARSRGFTFGKIVERRAAPDHAEMRVEFFRTKPEGVLDDDLIDVESYCKLFPCS